MGILENLKKRMFNARADTVRLQMVQDQGNGFYAIYRKI